MNNSVFEKLCYLFSDNKKLSKLQSSIISSNDIAFEEKKVLIDLLNESKTNYTVHSPYNYMRQTG